MNGWEFLEEYHKLNDENKSKAVIMMLSTSINPDDVNKAQQIDELKGYSSKPLTTKKLNEILKDFSLKFINLFSF